MGKYDFLNAVGSTLNAVAETQAENRRERQRFISGIVHEKIRSEGRGLGPKDIIFANIANNGIRSDNERAFVNEYLQADVSAKAPVTRTIGGKLYQYNPQTGSWGDAGIGAEPTASPTAKPLVRMVGGKMYQYNPDAKSWDDTGLGAQKMPSASEQFREDVNLGVQRIGEGETPESVIGELRQKHPTSFSAAHEWNLRTIGKKAQAELSGYRKQAIQELRKASYPTTENNIRSAIKQLRQPRGE